MKAKAITKALLRHLAQIGDRCVAFRDRETRHLIAAENVVVLNFFGHSHRVGNRLPNHIRLEVISKQAPHLLFGFEIFRPRVAKTLLIANQLSGEHAEQRVMGLNVIASEVVGIVGGHHLDPQFTRDLDDLDIDDAIFRRSMILNLQIEIVAEYLLIPTGHISGHIGPFPA